MDKFKKAIEQLNKPIRESKKSAEITPVRRAERKPAAEHMPATKRTSAAEPIAVSAPKQVIEPVVEEKKKNIDYRKEDKAERVEKIAEDNKGSGIGKYGIRTIIAAALIILAAIGIIANIRLNNQLKPVFYQVQSNKVVENVRVVAISDMHLKEFGANNIRLVEKIKSYHPDIIAILGDMNMDDNPDYSAVINLCARLNNVAPLYYSLGNHEFDAMLFKDSQIYYDMKAAGIKVLNNEAETIEVGLSTIDIIGVTQGPKRFREDAQKFFEGAMNATDNFKLVLSHYPENFKGPMEKYPIDLALCGHAHGGQVRLPVIGGLYSSDQGFLPQLCDGYHEIENSKVIISKGLGKSGVVPRINNAPEITIVDINWY